MWQCLVISQMIFCYANPSKIIIISPKGFWTLVCHHLSRCFLNNSNPPICTTHNSGSHFTHGDYAIQYVDYDILLFLLEFWNIDMMLFCYFLKSWKIQNQQWLLLLNLNQNIQSKSRVSKTITLISRDFCWSVTISRCLTIVYSKYTQVYTLAEHFPLGWNNSFFVHLVCTQSQRRTYQEFRLHFQVNISCWTSVCQN